MEYSGRQHVGEVLHCWKDSYRLSELGETVTKLQAGQCRLDGKKSCLCWTLKKREGGQGTHAGEMEWAGMQTLKYTQCGLVEERVLWMVTLSNIKTVSSKCSDLSLSAPEVRNVLHMEKALCSTH